MIKSITACRQDRRMHALSTTVHATLFPNMYVSTVVINSFPSLHVVVVVHSSRPFHKDATAGAALVSP